MSGIKFNAAQQGAIDHREGPLFISAGAGSGKTAVLVQRVLAALLDPVNPVDPESILSITFTRKAAQELLDRIVRDLEAAGRGDLARRVGEMWITTIHGAAARLLREQALEIGLDPGFIQIDEVTTARLQEQAFDETLDHFADAAGPLRELLDTEIRFIRLLPAISEVARAVGAGDRIVHETVTDSVQGILDTASSQLDSLIAEVEDMLSDPDIKPCGFTRSNVRKSLVEAGAALAPLRFTGDPEHDAACLEAFDAACEKYLGKNLTKAEYAGKSVHERAMLLFAEVRSPLLALQALERAHAIEEFAREWHERFSAIKERASALDYDDLLIRARDALRDNPRVAKAYAGRFLVAQIDEFQDTNELQRDLVKRLAGENLATVGDAQQSIYAFQGADIEVYRRHAREMDEIGAHREYFEENYRSRPEVLHLVNHLFGGKEPALGSDFLHLRSGKHSGDMQLAAPDGRSSLEFVVVKQRSGAQAEISRARDVAAEAFADRVESLIEAGEKPGDIVALFAARTQERSYLNALSARGIEAASSGGEYYSSTPVKLAGAIVRVLANAQDEPALITLLASDVFAASDDDLVAISRDACAGDPGRIRVDQLLQDPLLPVELDVGGTCPEPEVLIGSLPDSVAWAREVLVEARAAVDELPLATVIRSVIERSGWVGRLRDRGEQGRIDIAALKRFVRVVERFEADGGSGLHDLIQTLDVLSEHAPRADIPLLPTRGDGAVRFLTIHSAKGLEFKHVFLIEAGHWNPPAGGDVLMRSRAGETLLAYKRSGDDLWKHPSVQPLSEHGGFSYPEMRRAIEVSAREEKLHVLYVALTRAERTLTVIGSTHRDVQPYDPVASGSPMLDLMLSRLLPEGELEIGSSTVSLEGSNSRIDITVLASEPQEDGQKPPAHVGADAGDPPGGIPLEPSIHPSKSKHAPLARTRPELPDPLPQRISYSGFSTYQRCGRRFYFEQIVRVGRLDLPSSRSEALDFGSALHALAEIAGRNMASVDEERIAAVAAVHGVPSDRIDPLAVALHSWLDSPLAQRAFAAPSVRFEAPFTLEIAGEGVPSFDLDGHIDLYAWDGGSVLIVDYKTGGKPGEADDPGVLTLLTDRYRLQADCYALAALRDGASDVEVVFVRPEVIGADGQPQSVTFDYGAHDAAKIESHLIGAYRRMSEGIFDPLDAFSSEECGECPIAGTVCPVGMPALQRRRAARAR